MRNGRLGIGLSLYLDLVRVLAAMAVFGFHLGYGKLVGEPFGSLHAFGTNAVIVFFVLSGFVIAHVAATRERTATEYVIARLARVYSVALFALLITWLLDVCGALAAPDLYPIRPSIDSFVSCLFFVHEIWRSNITFGSMAPYWSLGYEVWYYIIAGLFLFCPMPGRFVWPVIAAFFVGPRIMELFPAWLLGVGIYRATMRLTPCIIPGLLLFVLPVLGFFVAVWHDLFDPIAAGIGEEPRQLALAYLSAGLFGVHLLGAQLISPLLGRLLGPAGPTIRWLAGASFTLYLLHLPIAFFLRSHMPWPAGRWQSTSVLLAGTLVGVLLLAEVTERRKAWWRAMFVRLLASSKTSPVPFTTHSLTVSSETSTPE